MKNKIKVRFNLGRGINYRKWKVEYPNMKPQYFDPNEVKLIMEGCLLKNYKKVSQRIFDGSYKTVCSWIICDKILVVAPELYVGGKTVSFNPRVEPNWVYDGKDADNFMFPCITSNGRELYVID